MDIKNHYSAAEMACLKLKGLPATSRGWEKRAGAEGWGFVEVPAAGGRNGTRREYYPPAALLVEIHAKLRKEAARQAEDARKQELAIAEAAPGSLVPLRKSSDLTGKQRRCAESRLAIVREVRRLAQAHGKTWAVGEVVRQAVAGELPERLQVMAVQANAKPGQGGRTLSRRGVFEWCAVFEAESAAGRDVLAALAPKGRTDKDYPWAPLLMKFWGQPQAPALASVLNEMKAHLPAGMPMPSYHQAYRYLTGKTGRVEVERGRTGVRALKNLKPHKRRDTEDLLPTDIYIADGHCFDAEVAHPDHGQPFRPEITAFLDVATRRLVGWSVDLAESQWAVLAALNMAAYRHGVPAMLYVDHGKGYKNALMKDEGCGVMARLGCRMEHATAYNAQAKGIIERSHRSIWVPAAKRLPTYIGKDMDPEARKKVFAITRAEIKATGTSRLLMSWPDFVRFCEEIVREYNDRPHSALPKIFDVGLSKTRHLSPAEYWNALVADGAEILKIAEWERDSLFRPYKECTVLRGEVRFRNNIYFSKSLEEHHGRTVYAGYELDDPEYIWVCDRDGNLLAKAQWNGNRTSYMPVSVLEQVREERKNNRLKRLAAKQEEVMQEANPHRVLEHIESTTVLPFRFDAAESLRELEALEPVRPASADSWSQVVDLPEPEESPRKLSDEEKYGEWLRLNDKRKSGELIGKEYDFWDLWPRSFAGKQLLRDHPDAQALLQQGGA